MSEYPQKYIPAIPDKRPDNGIASDFDHAIREERTIESLEAKLKTLEAEKAWLRQELINVTRSEFETYRNTIEMITDDIDKGIKEASDE